MSTPTPNPSVTTTTSGATGGSITVGGTVGAATPPEESQPARAATTEPDAPLGEPGKKALDAERAARKAAEKAAADALARVKQFEDAQKSETERLTEQLEQFKAQAAKAEAETLRLRVAADTGLSADLHEFLTGGDEESLRAQAQKLMAATATPTADPRRPVPDPSQGAKPGDGTHNQLTRADLAGKSPEWIEAAREAGRLNELLGIK